MDIQQLKYYRELCRVKNFTEAGFVCSLSQSALSKQIRRLEKELNVTLIRRNTRKFELTEEGGIFLEYAGQALERYEKMLEDIHSKKEIHIGSMTVLSPSGSGRAYSRPDRRAYGRVRFCHTPHTADHGYGEVLHASAV